jgi:hypothetical protein
MSKADIVGYQRDVRYYPQKADIDGAHSLGKLNAMRGLQKKRAQPDKAEPRT